MAILSVIRRWHFRQGMPIREIERRTGLSRNAIREYLRAGTLEPQFERPRPTIVPTSPTAPGRACSRPWRSQIAL